MLIGLRGTGKTSLAIIACTALQRRLVDGDQYFHRTTGSTRAKYRIQHDIPQYRIREVEVMKLMLAENETDCIITCGAGCVEETGQPLLQEYAKTHPVIHILRDVRSIQSYLRINKEEKIRRLLEFVEPLYRASSNLEFYNMSERPAQSSLDILSMAAGLSPESRSLITPSLTLKHAEQVFLHLINFIMDRARDSSAFQTPDPIPVESTRFTYTLSMNLSTLITRSLDLEELASGIDAFELKIDMLANTGVHRGLDWSMLSSVSEQFACIRRNVTVPIIYHVEPRCVYGLETSSNGTRHPRLLPDDAYLELVHHGLRLGAEYLTVDFGHSDKSIQELLAVKGHAKVIGHYTDDNPGRGGWEKKDRFQIYKRARALGCDIVRISQPATSMEDNLAVRQFTQEIDSLPLPHPPIIAYNTGLRGRMSCCFNRLLTPVTHRILRSIERSSSLPCITVQEAQEALYASFLLDKMRFCIFGASVMYSLSPAMHNGAYATCGMPHEYGIHQASLLEELDDLVKDPNFGGASITLPYKTQVMKRLSSESAHAKAIGAVNTVIPIRALPDGRMSTELNLRYLRNRAGPVLALYGDNTDWIGIKTCVRRNLSPANAITPRTVSLIIGAGGMARAAIYAMIQLGVRNILLYNRTLKNAQGLAQHYNSQTLDNENASLSAPNHGGGEGSGATTPTDEASPPGTLVTVVKSLQDPWPAEFRQPTIIVCCIPAHSIGGILAPEFTVPEQWLESPTGGVVMEVSLSCAYYQSEETAFAAYSTHTRSG